MNPTTTLRLYLSSYSKPYGRLTFGALTVILLGFIPGAFAETYVNRVGPGGAVQDVTLSDATWTATGSPYIVEAHVSVGTGGFLRIEPGVTVQVAANRAFYIYGSLQANNATFTKLNADNWRGVYFAPSSTGSWLLGCAFSGAGANMGYYYGGDRFTTIYVDQSAPVIGGCAIQNSANHGIEIRDSSPVVTNTTFSNLGESCYAVVFETVNTSPILRGLGHSGSGIPGIYVPPNDTIRGAKVWNNPGSLSYYTHGTLSLEAGSVWTIEAGASVKGADTRFNIYGTMKAMGTSSAPVSFSSRQASPAQGDWYGIYLGPEAGSSEFRYFSMAHASKGPLAYLRGGDRYCAMFLDACNPVFDHFTLKDCSWHGVELYTASPAFSNSTIENCGGHAVVGSVASQPTFANTRFAGNGSRGNYTLALDSSCLAVPSNTTFETNYLSGVQLWGGTLGISGTWKKWAANAPYVITGSTSVGAGVTLGVEAGTVIKLGNSGLYVEGTLLADGGPGAITFTSALDDAAGGDSNGDAATTTAAPGDWKGIYLSPAAAASVLNNCTIRYAGANMGYYNGGDRYTAVYLNTCSPQVRNCRFLDSANHGVELWSSQALVVSNHFQNLGTNSYAILYDTEDTVAVLGGNSFSGYGRMAVALGNATIRSTRTWMTPGTNFPYLLTGNIVVNEGVNLTIAPSTILKLAGVGIYANGGLLANATAQPITFTSWHDDTLGGDTDNNVSVTGPAPGDWRMIYLGPTSAASVLNNCKLRYGGANGGYIRGSDRYVTLYIDACSPPITATEIRHSAYHGIELWESSSAISNVSFENMGTDCYALVYDTVNTCPSLANLAFTGTGIQGIYLPPYQTMTGNKQWNFPGPGFVYYTHLELAVAEGASLLVDPGNVIAGSDSWFKIYGTLRVSGTAAKPVAFTSRKTSPSAGDWYGIYFGPAAGASELHYTRVAYAGKGNLGYYHGGDRHCAIYVDSCSPVFDHFNLVACATTGMEIYSGNPEISHGAFQDCARHALNVYAASRPTLTDMRFAGNGAAGYYTVQMNSDSVPMPDQTVFETNAYSGIQVAGGTLSASGIWKVWSPNAPYVLTGNMNIAEGVDWSLEPGAQVKVQNSAIYVSGILRAPGTNAPITFTSAKDDTIGGDSNGDVAASAPAAGDWKGINFSPGSGKSLLYNCSFRYAGANMGYFNGGDRFTTLYFNACSPVLMASRIMDSSANGVEMWSSRAVVRTNHFENFGASGYAVALDTLDSFPDMSDNSVAGSGGNGIWVPEGGFGVSGTWYKPGTNFPYHPARNLSVAAGVALTIKPGVTISMNDGRFYVSGILRASGTGSDPISFIGRAAVPGRGEWRGIVLDQGASSSVLRHVNIRSGGSNLGYLDGSDRYASVFLLGCNASLEALRVELSSSDGVILHGGSPEISSSLLASNSGSGLVLQAGASAKAINNTIVGNNSGAVSVNTPSILANNIFALNTLDGLAESGGAAAIHHNCFFGNGRTNYNGLPEVLLTNLVADPQFANLATANFRLQSGSPASNTGDDGLVQSLWDDLDGMVRKAGAHVEMGAYENNSTAVVRQLDGMIKIAAELNYSGENTTDLAVQTKAQSVAGGATAVYHSRWQYAGNMGDTITLNASAVPTGWIVRYYNGLTGSNEITAEVTGNGWTSGILAPGQVVEIRTEVTPDRAMVAYERLETLLTGTPDRGGQEDAQRMITSVAVSPGIDLLVRKQHDAVFSGKGVVNATGEGQTRMDEVSPGSSAWFYIQLANKGNYQDSFRLQGAAGGGLFTVQYFDAPSGGKDITDLITGSGWMITNLMRGGVVDLRVKVTASPASPGDAVKMLQITGNSLANMQLADTVKVGATVLTNRAIPQPDTYAGAPAFDKGTYMGTVTAGDVLGLASESVTLPFIWVPNSNEGSVSKVDTRTGQELARYRTAPPATYSAPSRTTVDPSGNCWVCNRGCGTVVKIGLLENGQWIDRNGNGSIETSTDLNGDGDITGAEMLPWGQDECVLYEVMITPDKEGTYAPGGFTGTYTITGDNSGPRAIASDAQGNVWAGHHQGRRYYFIDGATGQILRTNDLSTIGFAPYGAVIDAQGILWSASASSEALRLDPSDNSMSKISIGHTVYGLGLSREGLLYISGWEQSKLSRLNVLTGVKDWTREGVHQSRGVVITDDGDVWTANSGPGTVTRWSRDGVIKATIHVGNQPTGVAVDSEGKVWAVNLGDEYIHRINPDYNTIDLAKRIIGGLHYGYSDMTGIVSRNATVRRGTWSVIHNSRFSGTPWGKVSWVGQQPAGTEIKVRARSSEDQTSWSAWESCANAVWLGGVPPGQYLEVEVTLQVLSGTNAPSLTSLTVQPAMFLTMTPSLNQFRISWPAYLGDAWTLQRSTNLLSGMWWDVTGTRQTENGYYYQLITPTGPGSWFRMRSN